MLYYHLTAKDQSGLSQTLELEPPEKSTLLCREISHFLICCSFHIKFPAHCE